MIKYIAVATEEEKEALVPKQFHDKTIVTGIGMINAINTLKDYIDEDGLIVNVGFSGANNISKGTICRVSSVSEYQEQVDFSNTVYFKDYTSTLPVYHCYTNTDFLVDTDKDEDFLVDMELAAYTMLNNVESIKIVSDNLNKSDYFNKALKEDYTEEIEKALFEMDGDIK